ncbi:MAG: tetraacyldisaccharide 4'-kinase [Bdellovibrionaceae bacterium]|nr:tetraacyldisaccharide 4'-kinase [Pseudobdellovibrionaceae bacterium]
MKWIRHVVGIVLQWVILSPLSMLWGFAVAFKNIAYDLKLIQGKSLSKPVLSVGNLSAGGTGKTPVVLELMRIFNQKQIAVLSRGYGSQVARKKRYPQLVDTDTEPQKFGDEPSMIYGRFPKQKIILDSQRRRGGDWALGQNPNLDFFILDDGFQHRALHRDVDIVVFDVHQYLQRPGLLPLGRMREPLSSLKRANYIFLTKWQHLSQNKVNSVKNRLKLFAPTAKISLIHAQISSVRSEKHDSLPVNYDGHLQMISAIGAPDTFFKDLKKHFPNVKNIYRKDYPDHYDFSLKDIQRCLSLAKQNEAQLVCTTKDYIKIKKFEGADEFFVAHQTVDIPEDTLLQISEELFEE